MNKLLEFALVSLFYICGNGSFSIYTHTPLSVHKNMIHYTENAYGILFGAWEKNAFCIYDIFWTKLKRSFIHRMTNNYYGNAKSPKQHTGNSDVS